MEVKGFTKVIELVNGQVHTLRQTSTIHFYVLEGRKIEKREGNAINITQMNKGFHFPQFPMFPHWLI